MPNSANFTLRQLALCLLAGCLILCFSPQSGMAQKKKSRATKKHRERLDNFVNSKYEDFAPVISADATAIYFSRRNHPLNTGGGADTDVWRASLQSDGTIEEAVNVGTPLNSNSGEYACSLSPNGRRMLVGPNLTTFRFGGLNWNLDGQLNAPFLGAKSDGFSYQLTADGNALLMGLENENAMGKRDLFVSFLQKDGSFGEPINLGATINTGGSDYAPFMAADGQTLYFASEGHKSYGGADIFVTRRLDNTWTNWSTPVNLGKGVNSNRNDEFFTISADGFLSYISSDKKRAKGSDIYRVVIDSSYAPKTIVLVNAAVIGANDSKPIKGKITVTRDGQTTTYYTDPNGEVSIPLPIGQNYELYAEGPGHHPQSVTVNLARQNVFRIMNQRFFLTTDGSYVPDDPGPNPNPDRDPNPNPEKDDSTDVDPKDTTIVPQPESDEVHQRALKEFKKEMGSIYFNFDASDLKPDAVDRLARISDLMRNHDDLHLILEGHTDNVGPDDYNQTLSLYRAVSAKVYLIDKGVDEHRMRVEAYGEKRPKATNATPQGRELNRRVELREGK